MYLTEKQIQYGFYYYFPDDERLKSVVEVAEYNGEKELAINCTQLNEKYKPKEKKRILNEWIEFLNEQPDAFTKLGFRTRMPQELFEAVCQQKNLVDLDIKWGAYSDLSPITNLKNLELLHIGSGAAVESVVPISELSFLKGLYVENFKKVQDYSSFTKLAQLESLTICGDVMGPQYIKIDKIDFLRDMTQLRHFRFLTVRLVSGDYSPVLDLVNLESLSLRSHKDVKKIYSDLVELPKLKWGFLKERPEIYLK
ncbi:hypothetical protein [Shewanella nanhaiensis]|uniref:Leucine-rich repeat domain-containing protein n=1 Tax=Shewanella nanhaiensis TaxID=2864872 RepID=A0ABS7E9A9_9GAMM|nr:hypothetical protein [Shewanella nanhaiensis]MBW8186154.1 hypothetical protein [Shewanella nanhaiensis]